MDVSSEDSSLTQAEPRGPAARTRRLMLETAVRLMQSGIIPSVSEVAEAAEVSRATAYRYFPSQAALVHACVQEALGPILDWQSDSTDAADRIDDLLSTSMPRIAEFESTFKASLMLSLDQWARRQAGTLGPEPPFKRGHRVEVLQSAIAPLKGILGEADFTRLARALSLVYGLEVLLVLKDIWGCAEDEVQRTAHWAAQALITAALQEADHQSAAST